MRSQICALAVLVVAPAASASGDAFRGLPYYVKVESLSFAPSAEGEAENRVEVCYRSRTTVPILDYSDLASGLLGGIPVARRDVDGVVESGDPQPAGIEYRLSVWGLGLFAYLNAEARAHDVGQVQFFNSLIRRAVGVDKPLRPVSFSLSYLDMVRPQYEWVRSCEEIRFGKAFSEAYVRSLFRGPGPIGALTGWAEFVFTVFAPRILSSRPLQVHFRASRYAVPVFGTSALEEGDHQMISLSHYSNSLNVVRENLDASRLSGYLAANEVLVRAFEAFYGIQVPLPIDAEGLVEVIRQVGERQVSFAAGNGL